MGEGEAGFPLSRKPDAGLHPRTLGSRPELKAEALTHWATQASEISFFLKKDFMYLFDRDTAREGTQAGGVGEGEAGFPLSRELDVGLHPRRAGCGARSQDPGIMT